MNYKIKLKQQSKKNGFRGWLRGLDIFGVTYQFRVGKQKKFKSTCGGASFLFYITIISSFIIKSLVDYLG